MLYFRMGSQLYKLVALLSVVGEFPTGSISILGNERVYKALVHKLTKTQTIRNYHTGEEMTCRLFTITGKGKMKTLRFYKGALSILEWVHPQAYRYYMEAYWNHKFPGDANHRERNHRVAETAAMCMCAGVEFQAYMLPTLQNQMRAEVLPKEPVFYLAKELKKVGREEMNKTMFTRLVGALFCDNTCYAVYNTRNSVMKWSGMGEFKTLHSLMEIGRLNGSIGQIDSALLFGASDSVALNTLLESGKNHRLEFRFDAIYRHIHFIPLSETGIRLLRLMVLPDWKNRLLNLLFEPEQRSYDQGFFEYDACINGVYILSYLDGDLARLMRFKEAVNPQTGKYEVLCFPHQMPLIQEYLGAGIRVKVITMDTIEDAFFAEGGKEIEG